jgi:hypothetical protein
MSRIVIVSLHIRVYHCHKPIDRIYHNKDLRKVFNLMLLVCLFNNFVGYNIILCLFKMPTKGRFYPGIKNC